MKVCRHPFVPSSKLRNRAVHSLNGNTSPLRGRTKAKRRSNSLSNLRPFSSKKPKHNSNAAPLHQHYSLSPLPPTSKPLAGSNLFNKMPRSNTTSNDSEWEPPVRPPRPYKPRASTFSQITHSALIQLQQEANLSDSQLKKVIAFHRKETSRPDLYEPYFEKFLISTHKIFEEQFSVTTYQPPQPPDVAATEPIPLVICHRPLNFLQQLENDHNRKIRLVCEWVSPFYNLSHLLFMREFQRISFVPFFTLGLSLLLNFCPLLLYFSFLLTSPTLWDKGVKLGLYRGYSIKCVTNYVQKCFSNSFNPFSNGLTHTTHLCFRFREEKVRFELILMVLWRYEVTFPI